MAVGFVVLDLVGIEGLAHRLGYLADRWENEGRKEAILFAARAIESEPTLLDLGAHLLALARHS